ncbi:O-antigen ligase family protein [Minwuia sp.]|uniref:O-antigen ligase family protein n=1 Tax=Minwuia sp. TaxID=2493630 RepID=UPI003A90D6D9
MLNYVERLFVIMLIACVAFAPLPLGSNRPVSWSLLSLFIAGLLCVWALTAAFRPTLFRLSGPPAVIPVIGWMLIVGWMLLQTTGPEFMWHPLWSTTSVALNEPDIRGAIAVSPSDAATAAMRLLCYGAIFWLAAQTGREPENAAIYLYAIVVIGTVYALYGLIAELSGGDTIVGIEQRAYQDSLTSTFVNRNSFATFAGLAAVAAFGMLARTFHTESDTRSDRPRPVIRPPSRFGLSSVLLATALAILLLALLLTKSRAGLFSTGAGLAVVAWAWFYRRGRLPGLPVLAGGAVIATVLVLFAAGGGTFERKAEVDGESLGGRPWLFQRTFSAIADEPLTGHGGGSFESYFQSYKNADFGGVYAISKAHNSYLEFAADAGIPALILLLVLYAGVLLACFRGIRARQQDAGYPGIALAAGALVGLHALVDFSVQIPAVACLFALLLGVGYSQAFPTGGGRHNRL